MDKTGPRRSKRLMKIDLLTKLPQEMTIVILGRLPIRCITRCKCVCKSWRSLIEGGTFATSYTPKPWLAYADRFRGYIVCNDPRGPLCFKFDLPRARNRIVIDSANGLLLLRDGCVNILFICNPMTREYAELPPLPARTYFYGFGVSKLTGQYKILCADKFRSYYICTLGEEASWRSIAAPPCNKVPNDYVVFINGNLHWLEYDFKMILFTRFSLPNYRGGKYGNYQLCILEGKLCFCDILESAHDVIWWMNNYGDERSWIRVYTFFSGPYIYGCLYPYKMLANGDLFFIMDVSEKLFLYLKKYEGPLKPFQNRGILQRPTSYHSNIANYTPSFLSLKTMGFRNVKSLISK